MISRFVVILYFFLEFVKYSDKLRKLENFLFKTLKIKGWTFQGKNTVILYVFKEIIGEICRHLSIVMPIFWHFCENSRLIFEIGRFQAETPYLGSNSLIRE